MRIRSRVLLLVLAAGTLLPWTLQQELTAPGGAPNDLFGFSTSVSGNTVLVGAPDSNPGSAYVFVRSGGVWTLQQKLTASDGSPYDFFGISVALSGDTALIGASGNQGAAYVFTRTAGVWTQQQKLTASDGAAGDQFGRSVSVGIFTALIGAPGRNNGQGAAYVFGGSGEWSQLFEMTPPDSAPNQRFGASVSLSPSTDTAVVGAPYPDIGQGAAYVFALIPQSGGKWSQQQKLTASDGTTDDYFGFSVSISGDTALVGAISGGNTGQGSAYFFARTDGVWAQQQEVTGSDASPHDQFGFSVSLSGDTAVIGSAEFGTNRGAAYVWVRNGSAWVQQEELSAADGAEFDEFGSSVAVSGDTIAIGAVGKNSFQGAAYMFGRPRLGVNPMVVGSAAGTSSVVLSYEGAWTASANDPFLHISPGSSIGGASSVVAFTYDAFTGAGTRTGTLTIAGLTVTVTQAGTNYLSPGPVVTLVASELNHPSGVAADGAGNIYISDTGNNSIVKWTASAQHVQAIASTGLVHPIGVAVDSAGSVYFADTTNSIIDQWNPATSAVTQLVTYGLHNPEGVAVDGFGNVYIADYGGNAIKEWSASTHYFTGLASGVVLPSGVAVDGSGNVYFSDHNPYVLKEWSVATQSVTTLVSSGLTYPTGVAVDGSGNVYIADRDASAIKEWSPVTKQTITLASSGLSSPTGVAVDGVGNVYIADTFNSAVKEIPYAFVGPANLTETAAAGADSLLPVLPATASLGGIFTPTSDQSWLTVGSVTSGVVHFSFTANTTASARVANITVLGRQIGVTQNGLASQAITFDPLPDRRIDTPSFTLSASATSGLPVSFQSQTTSVCTVSNATVTLVAAGACNIQASQGGSADYAAAEPVSRSFQVLLSPCDLSGNSVVNTEDVRSIVNAVLTASTLHDLNRDSSVNVADIQIVINAAMSLGCPY